MNDWHRCAVCGNLCAPHLFAHAHINDDSQISWYTKGDDGRGHNKPTYFFGDTNFCRAACCLKWYEENKGRVECPLSA